MVQRTYSVMTNDVLISIPLFVFMGYIIERANILDRLFRSLQLAAGGVPGSLAIATLATCAIFATATGIVGAVVTLMGLLAFPAMLRAGYDVKLRRRRGLRRRLPRHPHPAERHADPLRRDRRRLGGEALCRRVLPRPHAGRALHALCRSSAALLNPSLAPQAAAGGAQCSSSPSRLGAARTSLLPAGAASSSSVLGAIISGSRRLGGRRHGRARRPAAGGGLSLASPFDDSSRNWSS